MRGDQVALRGQSEQRRRALPRRGEAKELIRRARLLDELATFREGGIEQQRAAAIGQFGQPVPVVDRAQAAGEQGALAAQAVVGSVAAHPFVGTVLGEGEDPAVGEHLDFREHVAFWTLAADAIPSGWEVVLLVTAVDGDAGLEREHRAAAADAHLQSILRIDQGRGRQPRAERLAVRRFDAPGAVHATGVFADLSAAHADDHRTVLGDHVGGWPGLRADHEVVVVRVERRCAAG